MAPSRSMVCFSFAAYAKALIARLRASGLPVAKGLSEAEFISAESLFGFTFPPDLRAVLREGLPVAAGFPDWRSSSPQQLHILVSLPALQIVKQVSLGRFWPHSWDQKPCQSDLAVEAAKGYLRKCPALVPIFRNCYVPAGQAGSPVFYVDSDGVRVLCFDIAGFFREFEFVRGGRIRPAPPAPVGIGAPVWAAKAARWAEFWSEAAAERRRRWWVAAGRGAWRGGGIGACMEAVVWRLREGGWGEEEVREMVMMDLTDGSDCAEDGGMRDGEGCGGAGEEAEEVTWRVRMLSLVLLRAGWTTEDVVYSLGLDHRRLNDDLECVVLDGDGLLRCC